MRKWLGWLAGIIVFSTMLYMCALPGDLPAAEDSGDSLAGTFTVNGVTDAGVEYSGTVIIAPADQADMVDGIFEQTYTVNWTVTGAIDSGVGRVVGNRFEVEWVSVIAPGGEVEGRGSYRIEPDGGLVGTRTVTRVGDSGRSGVGAELSERLFPDP